MMATVNFFSKKSSFTPGDSSPFFDGGSLDNGFISPRDVTVPEEQFIAAQYIKRTVIQPMHTRTQSTHVLQTTPILETEEDMERLRETKIKLSRAKMISGSLNFSRLRIGSASKVENQSNGETGINTRSRSFRVQVDANAVANGGKLKKWKRRLSGSLQKLARTQSHSPSELLTPTKNTFSASKAFPPLSEEPRDSIHPSINKEFKTSAYKSKNSEPIPSLGKYLTHSTSNGYLTKSYSVTGLEYNGRGNTLPRSHQKHDLNKHLLEGTSDMSVSISAIPHVPNGDDITAEHKVKSSSVSQSGVPTSFNSSTPPSTGEPVYHRRRRNSCASHYSSVDKLDGYKKLEFLGQGSYATVFKGVWVRTGEKVALKEIKLNPNEGAPFTAIREASLLKGLKHTNIITLYDIIHVPNRLCFVFEFVNTDLSKILDTQEHGLSQKHAQLFTFQLLRGLEYCHARKILHRDIKPQNLLISKGGELKLADFGLARAKSVPSNTYSNEVVTLWYRPPDVLLGNKKYSTSLDIWGVGCIFVEMLTGQPLFPGQKNPENQLCKIFQVMGTPSEAEWPMLEDSEIWNMFRFPQYPALRLGLSAPQLWRMDHAEDFAHNLLQYQPGKRLTAKEALTHPYFSNLPSQLNLLPPEVSIFSTGLVKYLSK